MIDKDFFHGYLLMFWIFTSIGLPSYGSNSIIVDFLYDFRKMEKILNNVANVTIVLCKMTQKPPTYDIIYILTNIDIFLICSLSEPFDSCFVVLANAINSQIEIHSSLIVCRQKIGPNL